MTECSPVICADARPRSRATCRRPRSVRRCRTSRWTSSTSGTTERVRARRVEGELRSRGVDGDERLLGQPGGDPRAAIERRRLLRSGDLARMDENGYVSITGRAKEMIIRGGENIYPAEIENAIRELAGVADAAVIGVPDDRYGEVCAAYVRLAEGAVADLRGAARAPARAGSPATRSPAYLRAGGGLSGHPVRQGAEVQAARALLGGRARRRRAWPTSAGSSRRSWREMSRPTMDRAIEAIEAGDVRARRWSCAKAMRHEWRFLHDLMAESMLGLVTYIQEKLGDDGVARPGRRACERGWKRDTGQIVDPRPARDRRGAGGDVAGALHAAASGPNPGALHDRARTTRSSPSR